MNQFSSDTVRSMLSVFDFMHDFYNTDPRKRIDIDPEIIIKMMLPSGVGKNDRAADEVANMLQNLHMWQPKIENKPNNFEFKIFEHLVDTELIKHIPVDTATFVVDSQSDGVCLGTLCRTLGPNQAIHIDTNFIHSMEDQALGQKSFSLTQYNCFVENNFTHVPIRIDLPEINEYVIIWCDNQHNRVNQISDRQCRNHKMSFYNASTDEDLETIDFDRITTARVSTMFKSAMYYNNNISALRALISKRLADWGHVEFTKKQNTFDRPTIFVTRDRLAATYAAWRDVPCIYMSCRKDRKPEFLSVTRKAWVEDPKGPTDAVELFLPGNNNQLPKMVRHRDDTVQQKIMVKTPKQQRRIGNILQKQPREYTALMTHVWPATTVMYANEMPHGTVGIFTLHPKSANSISFTFASGRSEYILPLTKTNILSMGNELQISHVRDLMDVMFSKSKNKLSSTLLKLHPFGISFCRTMFRTRIVGMYHSDMVVICNPQKNVRVL